MKIRKYVVPLAGVALLAGASFAFAQQSSKSVTQAQSQQSSTSGTSAYYCPYANSGMYRGMAHNSNMGRITWQGSGTRATFQKLQDTLNKAKSTNDPTQVKSLLNQAEQELSQLTSHMRRWFMGYGNGMMMRGGMMMNGRMMSYRMGRQSGYMIGNPPAPNKPQN
jgi:hypothetical protein